MSTIYPYSGPGWDTTATGAVGNIVYNTTGTTTGPPLTATEIAEQQRRYNQVWSQIQKVQASTEEPVQAHMQALIRYIKWRYGSRFPDMDVYIFKLATIPQVSIQINKHADVYHCPLSEVFTEDFMVKLEMLAP